MDTNARILFFSSRSLPTCTRIAACVVIPVLSAIGCATGASPDETAGAGTGGSTDASAGGGAGTAGSTGADVSGGGTAGIGGSAGAGASDAAGGAEASAGTAGSAGVDASADQEASTPPDASDALDSAGGSGGSAGGGGSGGQAASDAAAGSAGAEAAAGSAGAAGVDASAGSGGSAGSAGSLDAGAEPDVSVKDGPDVFVPDTGCTVTLYDGQQAPAAMLVVLDRSESMAGTKWTSAAQAIVQALDADVFDTMSVGLYVAPVPPKMTGPACIFGLPVDCQAPPFPQIDLTPAGTNKSFAATGVRRDIKQWLNTNYPVAGGFGDASPLYAGLQSGITALTSWPQQGKRVLLLVTDGTISCNQLSNPARPGFADCNGCSRDWEHPNNIVQLVGAAYSNATKPVETFVVGVPGADTYDPTGCNYPPYHMRLALSAIAYAGSPTHVDPNCTGTTFTQSGGDPAVPCHYDMTQGNFNAQNLANTIAQIRGKALGCVFQLPKLEGSVVDPNYVNVVYSVGDAGDQAVLKRSNANDPCTNDGCWDYDQNGDLVLIGKACSDVTNNPGAKVRIAVGCLTTHK
jgi:hypothetical protein